VRLEGELASIAAPDSKMKGDWDATFPENIPAGASASHSAQEEQEDLREEFETKLAQEQSLESRLLEVKGALARMEDSSYGICRKCNQPISEERLRANPAAEYDMEHQPQL